MGFCQSRPEFRRAIAANPNYPTAHQWYAECLYSVGRYDEAVAEAKRAQELDPLSPIITASVGNALYFARRYDEAIEQFKKALQLDANLVPARGGLGDVYVQKKMYPEAVAEWQEFLRLIGASAKATRLEEAYRRAGFEGVLRARADLIPAANQYEAAINFALMGKKDEALASLQKAFDARLGGMIYIKAEPEFDSMRSDPGFQALIKKMNFPQ